MALKSWFGDMSYVELPTSKLCSSENPARSSGKKDFFLKLKHTIPYLTALVGAKCLSPLPFSPSFTLPSVLSETVPWKKAKQRICRG